MEKGGVGWRGWVVCFGDGGDQGKMEVRIGKMMGRGRKGRGGCLTLKKN